MSAEFILALAASTLRMSTPLAFASLGGLMSERSGVINIALEGMMLLGAFVGAVVAFQSGSAWSGFAASAAGGAALAALYAYFVIPLRSNQIVIGTAINMLAAGIPPIASNYLFQTSGSTPALPESARFQSAPIWCAWVLLLLVAFWYRRLKSGSWVQFAGERPEALRAAGLGVNRIRFASVVVGGAFAGLGGGTLSLCLSSFFARDMTAGRGFMALAALILGKWRPVPAVLACLLFGAVDALQMRLQGTTIPGLAAVPVQFIQILPYLTTLAVLAGFVGKSRSPAAIGKPFP